MDRLNAGCSFYPNSCIDAPVKVSPPTNHPYLLPHHFATASQLPTSRSIFYKHACNHIRCCPLEAITATKSSTLGLLLDKCMST
uniref:Uncharacterized protein n=1 Tax=Triticum urartu TaxID=4572 RepID=A0A8R7PWR6_TRIUA